MILVWKFFLFPSGSCEHNWTAKETSCLRDKNFKILFNNSVVTIRFRSLDQIRFVPRNYIISIY